MISACIVGRDNIPYVLNCLESVRDVVDEVVFLDTGSSDDTLKVAREYADVILQLEQNEYNWGEWRNLLLKHATQEWILSIDTDEVATNVLRTQMKSYIKSLPEYVGHIRFKHADLIHDLKHFVTTPSEHPYMTHPRLYKREGSKWINKFHEQYQGTGEGRNWNIFGLVHYNMLLTNRLRVKTHPQYWDKEKYSDEFILKQWQRDGLVQELPSEVEWKERVTYGTYIS